ncbi:MAG: (d)CMP kinase [Acidobacteria bacterium]|nr:(d)CMP kinase [Acidobacteriota bacterium]
MHIVAIDGPAGSGKSSVSKAAAKLLGFGYLDTGAAYRALTWANQKGLLDCSKLDANQIAAKFDYSISTNPDNFWVKVGEDLVTDAIRGPEVGLQVSQIAQLPEVRKFMHQLTHRLVASAGQPGVIVEGRDITTVVFPEAKTRILLTASEEVRLARREAELPSGVAIAKQVSDRDKTDSKVVDFLAPAAGVSLIDSTNLNFDDTVAAVVELVKKDMG